MIKEKYVNPFTDFGFKKLFGEEVNKDLLIDFLNNLLVDEQQIKDLTYLKNEHISSSDTERKAIFDLYCENERGEKFIVELQKAKQNFFKDRSVYYSTFPIQEQAKQGKWNFELKAVYTIGILDFIFDDHKNEPEKLVHKIKLSDIEKNTVFYEKLTYIYLEMPKFIKTEEELKTKFDKWLYVLKHLPDLQDRPKALQERIFEKLFKTAEIAKFTQKERLEYEDSLKYYRDLRNVIDTAVIEKVLIIAKQMKKDREPIEKIIKYTGLSKEEIEKL
jgi:predicted transposase/invertase (TIGR01784 family)